MPADTSQKKYRYPGIYSFSRTQYEIFFGRTEEVRKLTTLINVESEILLYAKSGIGKTSLLNAGVIPSLGDQFIPVLIRFRAFSPIDHSNPNITAAPPTPVEILVRILKNNFPESTNELVLPESNLASTTEESNNGPESSDAGEDEKQHYRKTLWYVLKQIHKSKQNKTILLIFDQFEELFSYPDDQIRQFKDQLYDATKVDIPDDISEKLLELQQSHPQLISDRLIDDLMQPMPIKMVFSIRTDRLAFLDKMVDRFKYIRSNFLEIHPINEVSAKECILGPTQVTDSTYVSQFDIDEAAIKHILHTLSDHNGQIETTQLQIICEYIEKTLVPKKLKAHPGNGQQPESVTINKEDLPENVLHDVFDTFYKTALNKLFDEQRVQAEILLENELIQNEQRISLDEEAVNSKHKALDEQALNILVDSRILKREPNSFNRQSYELAHDTLISPILQRAKIKQVEAQKKEELRLAEAELARTKRRNKRRRNQYFFIVTLLSLFLFTTFYFYWDLGKKKKLADIATTEAIKATKRAEEAKSLAEAEKDSANIRKRTADLLKDEAIEAKEIALNREYEAEQAREKAEEALVIADSLNKKATEAEQLAIHEKNQAEIAKNEANRVLVEEEIRSTMNQALSLAARSLDESDRFIRAKMALEAYQIWDTLNLIDIGHGTYFHPTIYKSLQTTYEGLNDQVYLWSVDSLARAITFHPDQELLYAVSADWNILTCKIDSLKANQLNRICLAKCDELKNKSELEKCLDQCKPKPYSCSTFSSNYLTIEEDAIDALKGEIDEGLLIAQKASEFYLWYVTEGFFSSPEYLEFLGLKQQANTMSLDFNSSFISSWLLDNPDSLDEFEDWQQKTSKKEKRAFKNWRKDFMRDFRVERREYKRNGIPPPKNIYGRKSDYSVSSDMVYEASIVHGKDSIGVVNLNYIKDRSPDLGSMIKEVKGLNASAVAFSNQGIKLAIALTDGRIFLYDLNEKTNTLLYEHKAHQSWISNLVFSRNDDFLISSGWDHSLGISYLSDGQYLMDNNYPDEKPVSMKLYDYTSKTGAITFDPTEENTVVSAYDQGIKSFVLDQRDLQEKVCKYVLRMPIDSPDPNQRIKDELKDLCNGIARNNRVTSQDPEKVTFR